MKKELDLMSMYKDDKDDYYDNSNVLPRLEEPKILKRKNKCIRFISFLFLTVMIGLIVYLAYFQVVESHKFANSSYNRRRMELLASRYERGNIYSSDGKLLAYTNTENGQEQRVYPFNQIFAHVLGFSINGGSGIEGAYQSDMLNCHANPIYKIQALINNEKLKGDSIITTLDSNLQNICYNALGSNKGAVVILNVKTGAVLSMISKPDFNPNTVEENWTSLVADSDSEESVLLNRATQGLYPPGSTFKIMTALTYIREHNSDISGYSFNCDGSINFENIIIKCFNSQKHGTLDFKESFADSCNSSFVNIGLSIKRKNLDKVCESFGINKNLNLSVPSSISRYLLTDKSESYELMQTVIGQGKTIVTPIQMAMVSAAIANGGELIKPYFVEKKSTYKNTTIWKYFKKSLGKIMSDSEVEIMQSLMEAVVTSGTAKTLNGLKYSVAGKTGSAEYGTKGESHSWFTGYAPADNPQIAICVLVEGGGSGAEHAVPITKKILNSYYN